jgi:hypothetical protein
MVDPLAPIVQIGKLTWTLNHSILMIARYIVADAPKPLASFAIVARATAAEWRRRENAIYFVLPLVLGKFVRKHRGS